MAKEKQTTEQAVKKVKTYLLSSLPTGLTGGKQLEITDQKPKGEVLREFSWEIPVLQKADEETKQAIKQLKERKYKIYLTKIPLGGKQS